MWMVATMATDSALTLFCSYVGLSEQKMLGSMWILMLDMVDPHEVVESNLKKKKLWPIRGAEYQKNMYLHYILSPDI